MFVNRQDLTKIITRVKQTKIPNQIKLNEEVINHGQEYSEERE